MAPRGWRSPDPPAGVGEPGEPRAAPRPLSLRWSLAPPPAFSSPPKMAPLPGFSGETPESGRHPGGWGAWLGGAAPALPRCPSPGQAQRDRPRGGRARDGGAVPAVAG